MAQLKEKPKVNFNALPVPAGYQAGRGRGASGFTTRSDIGPAGPAETDEADEMDDRKFDEFMGNDFGIFKTTVYDKEDEEADAIWEAVDGHMDQRRRERREKRIKEEIEKHRLENPKITEQFADLKRQLAEVSAEEWYAIPEPGDHAHKKQKRFEAFAAVPDSMLTGALQQNQLASQLDERAMRMGGPGGVGGAATPVDGGQSQVTDLTNVGSGRKMVLSLKLDSMADSVSGQTVVDPKGYLTDLNTLKVFNEADISDMKKARHLMKSIIATNPKHAPGWIAMARLEEVAGKLALARQLIRDACDKCPTSEDVWLEASRLHPPDLARSLLARGVAMLPRSEKLWLAAARLETQNKAKSRVLRKALENLPTSPTLWKATVDLEDESNAKILLARAVECCPKDVDLWLALARLEEFKEAQKVLNNARAACPTEPLIWIAAAKLQEANGNPKPIAQIIKKGIQSLQANNVVIEREWWLSQAEVAEKQDPPAVATCREIVNAVAGWNVDDVDRKTTWMYDAEEARKHGSMQTARSLYKYALTVFPSKKSIWRSLAELEKTQGNKEGLEEVLAQAVQNCPQATVLWLMAAKEKWMNGDIAAARGILGQAFQVNQKSEDIWLAAVKLEIEVGEVSRAQALLAKAREAVSNERVWMKSALVERLLGNHDKEREFLKDGINLFPRFFKLHLMLCQIEQRQNRPEAARAAYNAGLKHCADCGPLWISAASLEESQQNFAKARALLEQGRIRNPKSEDLWLTSVQFEMRCGSEKTAESLMARALQDSNCPMSGRLWAKRIFMAPRPARKRFATDALKAVGKDAHVLAAMAELFWNERKVEKARQYYQQALSLDQSLGDIWGDWLRFERQHGSSEMQQQVVSKCKEAMPRYGQVWQSVSKSPENQSIGVQAILLKVADQLALEKGGG